MDNLYLILIGSAIGGVVAGTIALLLGGVGGQIKLQKIILATAQEVADLNSRVEREIKRRAVDTRADRGGPGDPAIAELVRAANAAQTTPTRPLSTSAEILAEGRRRGIAR